MTHSRVRVWASHVRRACFTCKVPYHPVDHLASLPHFCQMHLPGAWGLLALKAWQAGQAGQAGQARFNFEMLRFNFEMLRFNLKCSVSNKQATSNAGAYQVAYQTVGHLISKRLREGSERLREAPGTAGTYQVAYQTVRHLISKMLRAGQRRSVRHSYGQWWTCPVA